MQQLSTLRSVFVLLCCLLLTIGQKVTAQAPSSCFAIQGILVDACGTLEGENEMVSFQVGPSNLLTTGLTVAWPSNSFLGICQDATTAAKVAAFNRTIVKCGWLVEPVGGVLPAGKKVLLFCSEAVDTTLTSFANLQDTVIAIFQCAGNTAGHFKNYQSGVGGRTLTMSFSAPAGCSESVTYMVDSLQNQSGVHAAQDGEGAHFTNAGVPSYYWNPCMPPVIDPYVDAGRDQFICRYSVTAHLRGYSDDSKPVHWFGGQGTFGRTDTVVTTYTPSASDVFPVTLYVMKVICTSDTLLDSMRVFLTPPAPITTHPTVCGGQSETVGTHTYTTTGTYIDTLLSSAGCDSIIITNLTVDTTITRVVNLNGCHTVTYNGVTYTRDTALHQNFTYVQGCDSLVLVTVISINPAVDFYQSPLICQGQSFMVGINAYGTSGLYIDTFRNAAVGGCDSVVHTLLNVVVPYPDAAFITDTCTGTYKGHIYTSSAVILDTLRSVTGCDSVYLNVTINIVQPTVTRNNPNVTICAGDSVFAGGHYQKTPGTYRDTVLTISGCDSIITTTSVSILTPRYTGQPYDSCTAVSIHGISYASDTALTFITVSSLGCDSIIEIDSVHIKATDITILSTALLPLMSGDSTQLLINPSGTYHNIVWSPNQWINNRYLAAPTVLPDASTAYSVNAIDSNGCPVTASLIVTVTVSNEPDFVMPNAFSPNGDGKNDTFGPLLNPNASLSSFHIYNRWGELVFDKDVSNTSMWDGSYKNLQQPTGSYTYFVTVISSHGVTTTREGEFTLLR